MEPEVNDKITKDEEKRIKQENLKIRKYLKQLNQCLTQIIDSSNTQELLMLNKSQKRVPTSQILQNTDQDPKILEHECLKNQMKIYQLQQEYNFFRRILEKGNDLDYKSKLQLQVQAIDKEIKAQQMLQQNSELRQKFSNQQFVYQKEQKQRDLEQEAYNILQECDYYKLQAESVETLINRNFETKVNESHQLKEIKKKHNAIRREYKCIKRDLKYENSQLINVRQLKFQIEDTQERLTQVQTSFKKLSMQYDYLNNKAQLKALKPQVEQLRDKEAYLDYNLVYQRETLNKLYFNRSKSNISITDENFRIQINQIDDQPDLQYSQNDISYLQADPNQFFLTEAYPIYSKFNESQTKLNNNKKVHNVSLNSSVIMVKETEPLINERPPNSNTMIHQSHRSLNQMINNIITDDDISPLNKDKALSENKRHVNLMMKSLELSLMHKLMKASLQNRYQTPDNEF